MYFCRNIGIYIVAVLINNRGVTVEIELKSGTMNKLAAIGVSDGSKLTRRLYPELPENIKPWNLKYARFKTETLKPEMTQQINVQLGKGDALEVFNNNVLKIREVSRQKFKGKKANGRRRK